MCSISVSRFGLGEVGKRKDLGSIPRLRLFFLSKKVVVCGHCLVTLSITSYWNIKMALIAAHLNAGIESFWWWQCSDRYIISLPPPPYPLPHPFSPSLIRGLMVSVDLKHHWCLLTMCSIFVCPECVRQCFGCKYWGFLTCAQMMTHAIAHGGCTNSISESALKADSERKKTLPHQTRLEPASADDDELMLNVLRCHLTY